jgi:cobalt-zinc-cadmium resistance protein CzcA
VLNSIIHWSLANRFLVIVGALAFTVLGCYALTRLPIDAFPDVTPVEVQINTVVPSMAPEEVEQQVTFPVEQAISGLKNLQQMRSISKFGLSQVTVVFQDGTDIYFARQLIMERLATVELPDGVQKPQMGPVTTGLGEVLHYVVTSRADDRTYPRTVHDWVIKPAMHTVPGTAEINSWGGYEKQYQVRIDPEKLIKYDLTFSQVVDAVRANNLNVGGGNLDEMGGEMVLVHGLGRTSTVKEIANIVITAKQGVPIRVADVARVQTGNDLRRGAVTADGKGEVVLGLGFMLMGENGHEVTTALKDKLKVIRTTLPQDVAVEKVYDRTELVDQVIDTVRQNLFEGGLLVIVILFIFLGNLRAGLIVALAIPLSMLFAFAGMLRFGIAASLLSLGALDFGLVVDSSVVMVENVVRHLSHGDALRRPKLEVVRDAAVEVRKPTMFGELIIMIVYLPILTLEGTEGKMFRPMALTVIFALAGSMVLSLTLMPVLSSLLLPRRMAETEPLIVRLARRLYAPVLHVVLAHRWVAIGTAVCALAIGVLLARSLGSEFVPRMSEGALVIGIARLPGTSLDESVRYNTRMERMLKESFPGEIEHIWSRSGTAEVATDPMGVELTDMFVALKPRDQWRPEIHSQDELVDRLEDQLKGLPGQTIDISQPIEQRVNEMISGVRADLAIKIFGDDFDVLVEKAGKVEEVLRAINGASDVRTEQVTGQPVLRVRIRQDEVARYGVSARSVLDLIESVGGKPVGEVYEGQLRFPLVVRLPEYFRTSPEAVQSLLLPTPAGERIPLSRLADIKVEQGPSTITREWGQRRITVQCNIRGRDMGSFVAEAQQMVPAAVSLPFRYHFEWGGQFENLQRARTRLLIVVPLALALILVLLYLTYNRVLDAVRVFTGVPFAAVGGVVALWLRGMPFSISAGVGFIALSGVAVLGDMVLVSYVRHLREQGLSLRDAVEQAALTRLRPVLMTALVASLGFLPMAMSTGVGAEVQRPLATVVIGGVISSTLLTLLVLPALYMVFGSPVEPKAVAASNIEH